MEKYFFDIPIYRCSDDKHTDELDKDKQKYLQSLVDIHGPEVKNSRSYEWMGNYFDRQKWCPWRYNEIIGWIRLHFLGHQIRGELWFIKAKKIRKGLKNKTFYYRGKAFEILVYKSLSSEEIHNKICEILECQKSEWPIKGRYLDTELFKSVGQFIQWRGLLGFEN